MKMFHKLLLASTVAVSFTFGAGAETTLRFGHDQPVEHKYTMPGEILGQTLGAASNGEYVVKVFPSAQLGSEPSMIESVMSGNIDFSVANAPNASTFIPELGLFSVSYLFDDLDHVTRVLKDEKFQNMLDEKIESRKLGLKRASYFVSGLRNVYADRAVTKPEDVTGMKFRVMSSPVEAQIWGTFGAAPLNLPAGDIYTGMQTGLVQGAETTPAAYIQNKYSEVAPFYSLTEHQWSVTIVFANEKMLANLSPEAKKELKSIDSQIIDQVSVAVFEEGQELIKSMGSSKDVTVSSVDKALFRDMVESVQDQVATELGVEELLARIRELR